MAFSRTLPPTSSIVNTVIDERFEDIYRHDEDAIQLVNNGRTCEKIKLLSFGCALGNHAYSSGLHLIRLQAHGIVFLGIRSRNVPPQPDMDAWGRYYMTPSTYGWSTRGGRIICDGKYENRELARMRRDNHVFASMLNCDQHRLSLVDEYSNEQDEIEVDITHAPFPWCLFIELSRLGGRLSLV